MEPACLPRQLLLGMTMPWLAEAAKRPPKDNHINLRALLSCEAVSEELPLVVDGSRRPSPAMDEHLRTCVACQAELAGYRRLLRVLRSIKGDPVLLPAPELVGSMLSVLRQHPSWRPKRSERLGRRAGGRRRGSFGCGRCSGPDRTAAAAQRWGRVSQHALWRDWRGYSPDGAVTYANRAYVVAPKRIIGVNTARAGAAGPGTCRVAAVLSSTVGADARAHAAWRNSS